MVAAQLAGVRAATADAPAQRGRRLLTRLELRDRRLAIALAAVAGFVDASGFLASHGYFVSFMSGNSTRLGVAFTEHLDAVIIISAIILAFVLGVAAATRARLQWKGSRRHVLVTISLGLVLASASLAVGWPLVGTALMAWAMGAVNVVLADDGRVRVGLTYMTGALVRMGETLGGAHRDTPGAWRWYLALWIALVGGCALGATAFAEIGAYGVLLAAATTLIIAALSPGQPTISSSLKK